MRRILVIGCSGAGKSTLARQLGKTLGLEVIHLDARFWNAGWVETPKPKWRSRVTELIQREQWVMDGNYSGTLPIRLDKADTIIFLDFPRWLCLYRVVKRWLKYYGRTRPDLAENCPEKLDWEFVNWVWNYPERTRPIVVDTIANQGADKQIIVLRSPDEVDRWLTALQLKYASLESSE